jgi:DNA modification methylase
VAKAIISKYSRSNSVIVDFSAGYGGRLLGALALDRQYVGIEVNKSQILGYRRMRRAIMAAGFELPDSSFFRGRAERNLFKIPTRSADLVYSSPPFFNWERYSTSNDQSYKRYDNYDRWRSEFLAPVIKQSVRILSAKGYLILNVTGGNRLPTPYDVQSVARRLGFTLVRSHRMVFPKVPYLHPRNGNPTKNEVLLVFQK